MKKFFLLSFLCFTWFTSLHSAGIIDEVTKRFGRPGIFEPLLENGGSSLGTVSFEERLCDVFVPEGAPFGRMVRLGDVQRGIDRNLQS